MNATSYVKRLIPVRWKSRMTYLASRTNGSEFAGLTGRRKVVVALAADYPNLGDIAISHAQARFLREQLPDHEVVDFPCARTYVAMKDLKAVCSPEDVITIVGGGNMCDLYPSIEDARRFVIGRFPRNRIISFPQTMDFSPTAQGRRELRSSQRAYDRHRKLELFAREVLSLERMRAAFPNADVQLAPDIVLSLDASSPETGRTGRLLCIRTDAESAIPESARRALVSELSRELEAVTVTDTLLARTDRLSLQERQEELEAILGRFRAARVVVTDRLHGMIFAAITGTPCVALPNSNHKVIATHREWLGQLPHVEIVAATSAAAILEAVARVEAVPTASRNVPSLESAFGELRRVLREGAP